MKQRYWCGYCQMAFASLAFAWALSSCGEPQEDPQVVPSQSRDATFATVDGADKTDLTAADALAEQEPDRYSLDLASYRDVAGSDATGLWAPHQTVVVFPLDLRQPRKSILLPAPGDIQKVPTKAPCMNSPEDYLLRHLDDALAKAAVPQLDTARVEQVKLTMPYRMRNGTLLGSTGPICYGYRTTDNQWHWKLSPIVPEAIDKWAINTGTFTVGADRVDAFAILFHSTMRLREIELFVTRQ